MSNIGIKDSKSNFKAKAKVKNQARTISSPRLVYQKEQAANQAQSDLDIIKAGQISKQQLGSADQYSQQNMKANNGGNGQIIDFNANCGSQIMRLNQPSPQQRPQTMGKVGFVDKSGGLDSFDLAPPSVPDSFQQFQGNIRRSRVQSSLEMPVRHSRRNQEYKNQRTPKSPNYSSMQSDVYQKNKDEHLVTFVGTKVKDSYADINDALRFNSIKCRPQGKVQIKDRYKNQSSQPYEGISAPKPRANGSSSQQSDRQNYLSIAYSGGAAQAQRDLIQMSKGPSISTSEIKIQKGVNLSTERKGTYAVSRSTAIKGGALSPKYIRKNQAVGGTSTKTTDTYKETRLEDKLVKFVPSVKTSVNRSIVQQPDQAIPISVMDKYVNVTSSNDANLYNFNRAYQRPKSPRNKSASTNGFQTKQNNIRLQFKQNHVTKGQTTTDSKVVQSQQQQFDQPANQINLSELQASYDQTEFTRNEKGSAKSKDFLIDKQNQSFNQRELMQPIMHDTSVHQNIKGQTSQTINDEGPSFNSNSKLEGLFFRPNTVQQTSESKIYLARSKSNHIRLNKEGTHKRITQSGFPMVTKRKTTNNSSLNNRKSLNQRPMIADFVGAPIVQKSGTAIGQYRDTNGHSEFKYDRMKQHLSQIKDRLDNISDQGYRSLSKSPDRKTIQELPEKRINYKNALNQKFSVEKDLQKYSQVLRFEDADRRIYKVTLSSAGKTVPGLEQRAKMLNDANNWEKERSALKKLDWAQTPLYQHFSQHQKLKVMSKHKDKVGSDFHKYLQDQYEGTLTDLELAYVEHLSHRVNEKKQIVQMDKDELVIQWYTKVLHTLRVVMRLLGLNFHFNRLEMQYKSEFSVEALIVMVSRSRKMYSCIQQLLVIFKIVNKRQAQANKRNPTAQDQYDYDKRLLIAIKNLLTEHPLLPVQFIFGGTDYLAQLKNSDVYANFVRDECGGDPGALRSELDDQEDDILRTGASALGYN